MPCVTNHFAHIKDQNNKSNTFHSWLLKALKGHGDFQKSKIKVNCYNELCKLRERIAIRWNEMCKSRKRIAIQGNEMCILRERIAIRWEQDV